MKTGRGGIGVCVIWMRAAQQDKSPTHWPDYLGDALSLLLSTPKPWILPVWQMPLAQTEVPPPWKVEVSRVT